MNKVLKDSEQIVVSVYFDMHINTVFYENSGAYYDMTLDHYMKSFIGDYIRFALFGNATLYRGKVKTVVSCSGTNNENYRKMDVIIYVPESLNCGKEDIDRCREVLEERIKMFPEKSVKIMSCKEII